MTLEQIQEKLNQIKKGTYFTIIYKKSYGDYTKTTKIVVRLANYYNVVKKEPLQGAKSNSSDIHLGNNLIYNTNTNKTRLQVFLTNCPYHKPQSIYEYQGNEIDKDTFYQGTNKKPSNVSVMFTLDINDIVAIH